MKKPYLFLLLIILIVVTSYEFMSDFSPGTLGSVAETEFSYSSFDIEQQIDDLLEIKPFRINTLDSTNVAWWNDNGFDFLTFRCINIHKKLYMISINSENSTESTVSIRAYFNRNKKTWFFAKEFTAADNYHANKAMEYLSCELN